MKVKELREALAGLPDDAEAFVIDRDDGLAVTRHELPGFGRPAIYDDPSAFVAFDTETWLIEPGLLSPPLVCASYAEYAESSFAEGAGTWGEMLGKADRDPEITDWLTRLVAMLEDPRLIICGANIAFDVLVTCVAAIRRGVNLMPLWFAAYEADRVYDLQIAEALHAVGRGHLGKDPRTGGDLKNPETGKKGRYSLATCVDLVLGRPDAKRNDEWRLRYRELDDKPIAQWPDTARIYPIDDARNTLEVALAQCGHMPSQRGGHEWLGDVCRRCGTPQSQAHYGDPCVVLAHNMNLHDVAAQTRKHLGLHLGSAWGLRADPELVDVLLRLADATRDVGAERYVAAGFIRDDGTESEAALARLVALAYGASGACGTCGGSGMIARVKLSEKTGKPLKVPPVRCSACSYTGLDPATFGAVPRNPPTDRTPNGSIKAGRGELTDSGDELLSDYAISLESEKISETGAYGKMLRQASRAPYNPRPNPVLETGRTSYDGVVQTMPRQVSAYLAERLRAERRAGRRAPYGVRDCVVARPGAVFYSIDDEGGELVTFAESAVERVGWSDMGAALVTGINVHAAFACDMLGIPLAEYSGKIQRHTAFRQAAKPANFGFPGGMGGMKLALQQRKQGPDTPHPGGPSKVWDDEHECWIDGYKGLRFCLLIGGAERCGVEKVTEWKDRDCPPLCKRCIECAEELRIAWFAKWTEARKYLRWHAGNSEDVGWIEQLYSRRIRGGAQYTAEANGDFQALLADKNSRALWRVIVEQFIRRRVEDEQSKFYGTESPLFGSRTIFFAHDEQIGEAPEATAPEAAERVSEIMVSTFREVCPNHAAACKAEPTLMRALYKAAKPVYANGRLIPWEPKPGS